MHITENVLEHFSKEIHTYLQILNTSNMETEHAYMYSHTKETLSNDVTFYQ